MRLCELAICTENSTQTEKLGVSLCGFWERRTTFMNKARVRRLATGPVR